MTTDAPTLSIASALAKDMGVSDAKGIQAESHILGQTRSGGTPRHPLVSLIHRLINQ